MHIIEGRKHINHLIKSMNKLTIKVYKFIIVLIQVFENRLHRLYCGFSLSID